MATPTHQLICPSNVLPFSGERRTDARSYHGHEESRAPARGVAARPALERAAQAFIRCNGLLAGVSYTLTRGEVRALRQRTGEGRPLLLGLFEAAVCIVP
jgi:hypothetical protein